MKRSIITMLVVLTLLQSTAVMGLAAPSHLASAGVVYETNSGLEVELGDEREVNAAPFTDDQTFSSEGVSVSANGDARVRLPDAAFDGDTMQVTQIDATTTPVTLARDDIDGDVTVSDGSADVIIHNMTVDDGTTDLEIVADSATTVTVPVPANQGVRAVDASGTAVDGATTTDGQFDIELDAGSYQLQLQSSASRLEIRDVVNQTLITEGPNGSAIDVEVEFYGDDGAVERRTTTDGVIDMTGLPADERFSVSVDAGEEYVQRQILIPSLIEQQTAYLLPASTDIDTVEPRFTIRDPSNQFDPERSEIILERPIETDNGTEFVAVAGDRIGLNGFDTILERDQRYRVTVRDPDSGAQREVGAFTPTQSEQVTLTVQDVEFDSVSQTDGLEWAAEYLRNEESLDQIRFVFRDQFTTQSLSYEIYERGNESNVLASETAVDGNLTVTETVPSGSENTVWVVEWTTTRANGETLSASRPVSTGRLPVGPGLDPQWQTGLAMIGLFAVAGLFGAANPGVGGIAVAGTGGMFWLLGWLPDSTGGIMVALAMFIAVLAYVGRKARGAAV